MKLSLTPLMLCLLATASAAAEWPAHPLPEAQKDAATWDTAVGLRPTYKKCLDAAGGVVPASGKCISDEGTYQKTRLNAALQTLLDREGPVEQKRLHAEQQRWIAFMNEWCSPSDVQLLPEGCRVETMADRAAQLEERWAHENRS